VILLVRREVMSGGVSVQLALAPTLPPVLGDRVQLQQVIINLVINGIQAMAPIVDRSRDLTIETRWLGDAEQVLVAVRDSGIGIDTDTANRLFDAFFTTKNGGLGMGLSICRSIVEAHGGRVWASSNDGRGATFQFTLNANEDSES
jgi:signal transduction histidine kinase